MRSDQQRSHIVSCRHRFLYGTWHDTFLFCLVVFTRQQCQHITFHLPVHPCKIHIIIDQKIKHYTTSDLAVSHIRRFTKWCRNEPKLKSTYLWAFHMVLWSWNYPENLNRTSWQEETPAPHVLHQRSHSIIEQTPPHSTLSEASRKSSWFFNVF